MERIAIIDHDEHQLFVEDIDETILNRDYGGEEEAYIKDNYNLENFSWDYIVRTEYYPENGDDPMEVDFTDLL